MFNNKKLKKEIKELKEEIARLESVLEMFKERLHNDEKVIFEISAEVQRISPNWR